MFRLNGHSVSNELFGRFHKKENRKNFQKYRDEPRDFEDKKLIQWFFGNFSNPNAHDKRDCGNDEHTRHNSDFFHTKA